MQVRVRLSKHGKGLLARATVIALVGLANGGAAVALALLPSLPHGVAGRDGSAPSGLDLAAMFGSATSVPTPLEERLRATARSRKARRGGRAYYRRIAARHVAASVEPGYMPLYLEAAHTFGVSWQLIASIHRQETAFSAAPSTYHGLNPAGCCAGPMQFNVENGPVSTWDLYSQSYRAGSRPRRYPHQTASHPSVYDDFDSIMAAGALLRASGATQALDGGAWAAAYDYYGHDLFGIDYASEVVGRALGWQRSGFCLNCAPDGSLVASLTNAYGGAARAQLLAAARHHKHAKHKKHSKHAAAPTSEQVKTFKAPRHSTAGDGTAVPTLSQPTATPPPSISTPPPPATTTPATTPEAPPPAPTPPPPNSDCTPLHRLFGCGG